MDDEGLSGTDYLPESENEEFDMSGSKSEFFVEVDQLYNDGRSDSFFENDADMERSEKLDSLLHNGLFVK